MAAIQARALTAPIVAQPAQLSMKLSFCTEFAPARRGTAYAPQSAGYRGITDAGDSRDMRHEMHGRQALRPDRHHVASGRLGSVEQCGTSEGVSVIADVPAVVALDLRDAGIVVHGDDADRHVGLDLAHDAAVTQRVDRNLGRVAKLFRSQSASPHRSTIASNGRSWSDFFHGPPCHLPMTGFVIVEAHKHSTAVGH